MTTNKQHKRGGKASARPSKSGAAANHHNDGKASVKIVAAQVDHGDDTSK
jgi:hypothetical protein